MGKRILSIVSRKTDGTERSGRGTAPSAAGGFGGADTALMRLARPFVPRPFLSNGGMSASADTMLSIGMGRHNNDDEMPEDQVNVAAIVDRKVSDRRYLPRRAGNMKRYLHTTPISESLDGDDDVVHARMELYEDSIADFIGSAAKTGISKFKSFLAGDEDESSNTIEKIGYTVAPFIPLGGELWYFTHAIKDFNGVRSLMTELEKLLAKNGINIDMTAPPMENNDALTPLISTSGAGSVVLPSAAIRAEIRASTIDIAIKCFDFLIDTISALPLELIPGLSTADMVIDSALTAAGSAQPKLDPEGEKIARALFDFSLKYGDKIKAVEDTIASMGRMIPGISDETLASINSTSNFIGNLALLNAAVSDAVSDIESSDEPDMLAERRRRKKTRTNEFSGAGAVAGYAGPIKSPRNPQNFYNSMAKAAGGQYVVDPLKIIKQKP